MSMSKGNYTLSVISLGIEALNAQQSKEKQQHWRSNKKMVSQAKK